FEAGYHGVRVHCQPSVVKIATDAHTNSITGLVLGVRELDIASRVHLECQRRKSQWGNKLECHKSVVIARVNFVFSFKFVTVLTWLPSDRLWSSVIDCQFRAPTLAVAAFQLLSGTLQIGHSLRPLYLMYRGDDRFQRVSVHPTPLAIVRSY